MYKASHELSFFRQFLDSHDMPIFDASPWYHTIHDLITLDEMKALGVHSADNIADIFIKLLSPIDFAHLRRFLGICPPHLVWGVCPDPWILRLTIQLRRRWAYHILYTSKGAYPTDSSYAHMVHTLFYFIVLCRLTFHVDDVIPMGSRRSVDSDECHTPMWWLWS